MAHSSLNVVITIALLISLWTCFVRTQSVQENASCTERKTFQSRGRNDYQCPQCASVCQVRNILFKVPTNPFSLAFGPGVYNFEERPNSIQDVIGHAFCPGKYCLNREKCDSFDGFVIIPRCIFDFGKCGAWLFVHKVPFTLHKDVETTKTDKTRFFVA